MARIDDLEKQLKETKQTFGNAILTLVERVKTLEVALKRKTKRLVTPSKTVNALGEEQVKYITPTTLEAAAILTKVKKIKSVDKGKRYKRRKSSKESAGTGLDFEEVKSAFEEVNIVNPLLLMHKSSVPSPTRLDALEKALEKEEVAKQVHLDSLLAQRMAEEQELTEEQKKRKAQVQFEAQSYTEED
ncbi:hypothetical protein Tco_0999321 [Tanacetum coccineum]